MHIFVYFPECNNPMYLVPGNSSEQLAFPEANWDTLNKRWQGYNQYPTSVVCNWVLRAPPQHVISAKFIHFDTEEDFDFVKVMFTKSNQIYFNLFFKKIGYDIE